MNRLLRRRLFSMLSLTLVSLGIVYSAQAAPPSDEQLISTVEALAAKELQEPGGVGLSIAIARGGEIIHAAGYGLAEVEHGVKANAETTFRIGSITKQFSAALVMKLREQGKLSLDDEITRYFPEYPMQGHTVTVRHLLNHTSGIKSYTGVPEFWVTGGPRELTVDELLAYVKDVDFDFAPGEQYKYNNTAYYMIGSVIAQASGMSYCEYLQNEICTPMSLGRTQCDSNAAIIPNRAQGYGFSDGKLVNDRLIGMDNPGAAGMMLATARDLVAWNQALVDGKVVNEESFKLMTTPNVLPSGKSTGYGFGLSMGEFEGHPTIGHGGGIFGFNSMLTYYPDDDLYIAVISNGGVNSGKLAKDIARAALDIENSVADLPVDVDLIKRLCGTYAFAQMDMEMIVAEKDGELFMKPTGQGAAKLLNQGNGEFRISVDTDIKVVFDITTTDGPAPALQVFQGGNIMTATRTEDE